MKPHTLLLTVLLAATQTLLAANPFVHPGARYGRHELEFVKERIALGENPWTSRLNLARLVGSNSRALGLALNWYHTGNTTSAKTAISILRNWSANEPYDPPPVRGGNQSSLEGAWAASVLAPAAEILSLYPGWSDSDKQAAKEMFRTVFLPALMRMSYWNGNVDLTQIDALLSVAVFLEDTTAWNEGIRRLSLRLPAYFYLGTDPDSVRDYANGAYNWSEANGTAPLAWVDGLMQESCRDNGHHGQFAIAAALAALETAWLQGVDLYAVHQERMVAAMELLSKQLVSKDMQGACEGAVTTSRFNTLEIGYNHYHGRKGLPLPETRAAILGELRSGAQQFNMFHETLTHGDIVHQGGPSGAADRARNPSAQGHSLRIRAGGLLEIEAGGADLHDVRVLDPNGARALRTGPVSRGNVRSLALPGSARGIVIVTLRDAAGTTTRRLVR